MTNPAFIILFAILFLFSVYIGFLIGQTVCEQRVVTARGYWAWNIGGIVLAVVLSVFLATLPLLYAALFGVLAGYIAGMRMSFGEAVGPWKALDRFLKREGRQKVAGDSTGDARRRRRKSGEAAPDLISVKDDSDTPVSKRAPKRSTKSSSKKDMR